MASKQPVYIPDNVKKCKKCKVLMPIPGIVTVSRRFPHLCSDCAGDNKEVSMTRITEGDVDRARVQVWAEWRREGKAYDEITQLDSLSPSYPTIKRYLEKYGYDGDGNPLNGSDAKAASPETPDGWGKVESEVLDPNVRHGTAYLKVLRVVLRTVTKDWQRIAAPSHYRARKLSALVREQRSDIERRVKEQNKVAYFYFRLKPGKNGAGED